MARNLDLFFHDLEENSDELKKKAPDYDRVSHRTANAVAAAMIVRSEINQEVMAIKNKKAMKQIGGEAALRARKVIGVEEE